MAADAAAKPVYMFYHIQGERGESPAHPNACRLTCATPGKVTFGDVLASFPLAGTASFHFRFQVTVDKQVMFLDLSNPDDVVPMFNGSVIAKILRLDTAKCASRLTENLGIRLRQQGSGSNRAASRPPPGAEPSPKSAAPVKSSSASVPPAAIRTPPVGDGRDSPSAGGAAAAPAGGAGATRAAANGVASSAAAATAAVLASAAAAASSSSNSSPVVVPDEVDADLEGKSDYVKAKVMERRAELKRQQEARLAEVAEREREKAAEQEERDRFKAQYDGPLAAWSSETGGAKKNIRVLLSTLHTVLWEGAKWEPVPMAKLVMAAKVKFWFMKAITIVHPDKQNTMEASQRYVATAIFHSLENAYRTFQETEMS